LAICLRLCPRSRSRRITAGVTWTTAGLSYLAQYIDDIS
jgi:hypothetical protein